MAMGRIFETIEFNAPLDRVWKLFTDPEDWTKWNKEWSSIRDVRGPFDHAGAGYTQVMRILGREWLGRWEVTACEPSVSRQIAGTLPFGVPFRGQDRFQEPDGITRVTVEVEWDTPWGWLGRTIEFLGRPLMRRQFRSNARNAARLLT
jgi:ligand-binding SRPBCC domain-containing protein